MGQKEFKFTMVRPAAGPLNSVKIDALAVLPAPRLTLTP